MLTEMTGIPCDEAKSKDLVIQMMILGCTVTLNFEKLLIRISITDDKVRRYSEFIQHILDTDIFTPGDASRMVGKFGFCRFNNSRQARQSFHETFVRADLQPNATPEIEHMGQALPGW